jgi:hypothetical protein
VTSSVSTAGHERIAEASNLVRDLATALAADGYALQVNAVVGARVDIQVVALAEACPECLVPKSIMSRILAQALEPLGTSDIALTYPDEHSDSEG